jgi:signal transduction histidine kinase
MRRRIFLTIVAVAVATVILFGLPLALAVDRRNDADAVLELQRFGSAAASQVPDDFAAGSTSVDLPVIEPEVHLAVYDRAGQLVSGTGPQAADHVVSATADGAVHQGDVDGELVVALPIVQDGQVVGAVRSSERSDEAMDRTHRTWFAMAGLAGLVAAIAAVAGLLLSRHLTRPVRRLRDAAVRLGDGDFTVTAPLSGVAELDSAAEALATTAQRLGDLVERERAFTADASHQLRTPLTSLRLALETELAQPRPDATLALNEALTDVDRLEATLSDLLALARDTVTDRRAADLTVLLGQRETIWRDALASSGRRLSLEVDRQTPHVLVSTTALVTVLDVLVDNAVHHGRGTVTIDVAPGRAGGASIVIADEGQIRADPETIFDRRSSPATGHGIGLALARSLARAEGGRLWLLRTDPTAFEVLIAASADRMAPAETPVVNPPPPVAGG